MSIYTHRMTILSTALATLLLATTAGAQSKTLVDEDWYGEVKKVLSDHYTGKTVRLKLPIPATRRGLEMFDGAAQREATKAPPQFSAQAGEELTIKSFRVYDSSVEVLLDKEDEQPRKSKFPNPLAGPKQPRVVLRFSHELSSKDLTIESLNHFLSSAMDVSDSGPMTAENAAPAGAPPTQPTENAAARNPEIAPADTAPPSANIVADSPIIGQNVGELTVECSVRGARMYIDGSYSGDVPRTLRLRTGFHTILIVNDGYESWERRLLIPGGKISVARADLKKEK
jgi:hypothetical protein